VPIAPSLPLEDIPHITVIRPVKGLEPYLYECLASTFLQSYPPKKLTIFFCVSSRDDPAFPILERTLADFPGFDASILVEEEDPNLSVKNGTEHNLGPNPKIRNMSRAYRKAKGDIIWVIDCNVWVTKSVAGLMVDQLCGFSHTGHGRKYKFVHQLPLVVDVSKLSGGSGKDTPSLATYGGLMDEMFLSTSHAIFYTAISAVAIAPCTVGKSNMFRRSHLDALTPSSDTLRRSAGIDYFSENICEDHLIGDLLWKSPVPDHVRKAAAKEGKTESNNERRNEEQWGNHTLITMPPCVQPVDKVSIPTYTARRTRWLRVRKFTVPAATLVEPGTESLLCSLYGAFGLTTYPKCAELGIPQIWTAFLLIWVLSVVAWGFVDHWVWSVLQKWSGEGPKTPEFVGSGRQRPLRDWIGVWLGREILAGPIWVWAVLGGTTVVWRGRKFWVGMDMRVHEVEQSSSRREGFIARYVNIGETKEHTH
jgi:ceramide glucosyltransferase